MVDMILRKKEKQKKKEKSQDSRRVLFAFFYP